MNIGIDESGNFAHTDDENSWSCVVAYAYAEVDSRHIQSELQRLRTLYGQRGKAEIKLKDLSEQAYIDFLIRLHNFSGVLYAVATNAALNTEAVVSKHQAHQVSKILANVDKMLYEEGRSGLRDLASRVRELHHQLYIQMICQTQLVAYIVRSAIVYFVQRRPSTLGRFRWRIDQKNSTRTSYEKAYSTVLPAFLQSSSLRDPLPMLEGQDYSHFERFDYPKGSEPTYLRDIYGIESVGADDCKLNIGKLVHENVQFVDSRSNRSVQVADLLASGLRRCLRGEFHDNLRVAKLLGSLTVQREHNMSPVQLVSLAEDEQQVHGATYEVLSTMRTAARAMLVR